MTVPESRQGSRQPAQEENVGASVRPATNHSDLVELPPPTEQQRLEEPGQLPPKPALKTSKPQAQGAETSKQTVDLKEGQFDENESHSTFLEALHAWRGTEKENKQKQVSFGQAPDKSKRLVSKKANENETKPSDEMKFGPKEACWSCYKLFSKEEGVECKGTDKKFCSKRCLNRFEGENMQTCQVKKDELCSNKFLKTEG